MAKKKKAAEGSGSIDFTGSLIKDINKNNSDKIAFNLSQDISPTHIKRWISTGILGLDYICSNIAGGGLPEGRIVEIFGPPSIGKSHLAAQICRSAQLMGGIAVYIDSETAVSVENLENLGVDVYERFVYVNEHCTEHILSIAEQTMIKARSLDKDVPVVIVWDSVAASSPKAELEGTYEQNSIGLNARAISKGMRKITGIIGNENVLFVILNQTRTKIGVMYGDPETTPGGSAIPFHASTRIKLSSGKPIKNKEDEVIGINVIAKTIKNKVAPPFRTVRFEIHFGVGIREGVQMFDMLRKYCSDHGPVETDKFVHEIAGTGAWKTYTVEDLKGKELYSKKFYKTDFEELLKTPDVRKYLIDMMNTVFIKVYKKQEIDLDSYEEVKEAQKLIEKQLRD